ncbi:unnamed protein product, partial [Closterium sp. NIES-54]
PEFIRPLHQQSSPHPFSRPLLPLLLLLTSSVLRRLVIRLLLARGAAARVGVQGVGAVGVVEVVEVAGVVEVAVTVGVVGVVEVVRVSGVEEGAWVAFEVELTEVEAQVRQPRKQRLVVDSSASWCFFRDRTTVTSLPAPVLLTLADPSSGPVIACGSTVLPCPTTPSGSLTGFHLPSFATNLVSTAHLQDPLITTTTPGCKRVAICQVAASCSSRLLTHPPLLWHHRLGHLSLQHLRRMHSRLLVSGLPQSLPLLPSLLALPCTPCVEGRLSAAPHSSFPPTTRRAGLRLRLWAAPGALLSAGRRRLHALHHGVSRAEQGQYP